MSNEIDVRDLPKLKGPIIQRDVALLIRMLRKVAGWDSQAPGSIVDMTHSFLDKVAQIKTCSCSSCTGLIAASSTSADLLDVLLPALFELPPEAVAIKIGEIVDKHLMSRPHKNEDDWTDD